MPGGFSSNDIQLLSQAVYSEARGEPYEGQVAIAAVILNRLNNPTFPNTIAGVIFEPLAFTAVADGQFYMTPDETAKKLYLMQSMAGIHLRAPSITLILIQQQVHGFGEDHKLNESGNIYSANKKRCK